MTTYDPNSEEHKTWQEATQRRMEEDIRRQQQNFFRQFGGGQQRPQAPPPRPQFAAIPPDILKRLIILCHPDKHNNSPMSTEMTQWLLKQRV